jgi:hypothetical protein
MRARGILNNRRDAPHSNEFSNFRELLPCVTLWIAALSQGSVGKILTHPLPLSCDVSSGLKRPGGPGSNVKEGPQESTPVVISSQKQK